MRALAALALALVCAVLPAPASAQGRDNVYVVAGVQADATAANAAEARTLALANANQIGFERLVRRLSQPADFARFGVPAISAQQLENLIVSFDVEEERRSGTRYLARLTLRFNPDQTRAVLRNVGYTPIETRTAPMLVVPRVQGGDDATAAAWVETWAASGLHTELVPLVTTTTPVEGSDWTALAPVAQTVSAASALIASLRVQGSNATVTLQEVNASGARDRGSVTGRISGDQRAAFAQLITQASDRIQAEYKARSAVSGAGGRISASALYQEQAEWERIKQGLERAAATSISEIRIEAVGRSGALVSFSFTGNQTNLVSELRRHGVTLEVTEIGPVLRTARR